MSNYNESSYEHALIELFQNMGWEHVYGPDIERNWHSPLYDSVLEDSIRRINPKAAPAAIDEALLKLRHFENAELKKKNAIFMEYLQNGIEVSYHQNGETKSDILYIADFENAGKIGDKNSYIIANQWTFIENSNKRPDILLFLNGLPICLFELKSPSREQTDASEAYTQIRNYMQEIPSIFIYNCICVLSDQLTSKAGTITSGEDRFMEWKTKDGTIESSEFADFSTFFEGIFQKARLLNIIKNFICFNNDGINSYKILAGYHQYFAVCKAVERTKLAVSGDGKIGVFWHTQGSGKSLSMVFYAHLLQQTIESPTIVVITDRNDLDNQLYTQFCNCANFLRQEPVQAESREHLKKLLEGRKANGIIFTTMQKFEEGEGALSDRRNIIVMADEAHRGQYGLTEKIRTVKDKDGKVLLDESGNAIVKTATGTARIIRDSLPNASYIGFTGTPISREDRSTIQVFGDYIDVYDMTQAVLDGATRPVYVVMTESNKDPEEWRAFIGNKTRKQELAARFKDNDSPSSMVKQNMRLEAAFFEAVRVLVMRLLYNPSNKKFSLKEINERINELLTHSVKSDGVINLFSDVGEKVNLFDPTFLENIGKMKEKNLAVEMLKKLIDDQVKVYKRTNLVKSEAFSVLIQQALNRYLNGMLTNEEVIQELLKLAKEMFRASEEGNKLGLTDEELAFYDALTKPEAVKDFYSNEELVALTKELTETLRKNKTIDWQKKGSARAKMRMIVKKLLKKYKYPPEGQDDALKTVISQCELWIDVIADFDAYPMSDGYGVLKVAEPQLEYMS